MLKRVNSIAELGIKESGFVDCYLSCDSTEADQVLMSMGFFYNPEPGIDDSFSNVYLELGRSTTKLKNSQGVCIESVDIPIDEDLRQREALGNSHLASQAKIRIYKDSEKILENIMKGFVGHGQDVIFVNPLNNKAHVASGKKIDVYFCPQSYLNQTRSI